MSNGIVLPRHRKLLEAQGFRLAGTIKNTPLSDAQRETLECCTDWSAAFEVLERRAERFGSHTTWQRQQDVLRRLETRGLVEFGKPNATYRVTQAGRSAIAKAPGGQTDE